jgi:hypothetical protein
MNEHYLRRAEIMLNQKLFKTEGLFFDNFLSLSRAFKENFRKICIEISELQKADHLDGISYIEYTLLRTNTINKDYAAEIRVYGEEWYLCKNQHIIDRFDISFLLQNFDMLWTELLVMSKQYVGKVSSLDISGFMMDAVSKFYAYVISLCRFSILECIEQGYFRAIKKTTPFSINIGEYMAKTETIYKEDSNKDSKKLLEWFADRLCYEYCFEDFSGLDFSNEDFFDIDLRYSDLRNTQLANTDFTYANLIGARFCGADLENADFTKSIIYEADFSCANLQNAKFNYSEANWGIPDKEEWKHPGFFKVSFRNVNLQNADFTGANLIGADFTEAVMDGVKFDLSMKNELDLSPEQMGVVVFK